MNSTLRLQAIITTMIPAEVSSGASGIDDDGSILDAVNLNNLDDWYELHAGLG